MSDPKTWVSVLALAVSIFSAVFSWRSLKNSTRALAISESQERRRQPQLVIYLAKAYRRRVLQGQLFGFLVSISNPTDINNSIARAEIKITYRLRDGAEATCRMPHNPSLAENAMR